MHLPEHETILSTLRLLYSNLFPLAQDPAEAAENWGVHPKSPEPSPEVPTGNQQ